MLELKKIWSALVTDHNLEGNPWNSNYPQDTPVATLELGGNFFTQSNFPMGGVPCLAFDLDDYVLKNPVATFDFTEAQTFFDLENALGIDISSSIGWALFSADARVDYATSQSHTNYDINVNYIFKYTAQAVLRLSQTKTGTQYLSAVGLQHYNNGAQDFTQNCGDGFIQQANAGATLIVTYNLQFNNELDKQSFQTQLDASYGIGSISTKIQQVESTTKSSVTVNLKAIQIGGNPERLQDVLGQSKQGEYPILECGQADPSGYVDLSACSAAIGRIIDYAHAQGAYSDTGLEKQIAVDQTGHPVDPTAFYYTNPVIVEWSQINADPGIILPTPEMIQDQADLTNWYRSDANDLAFLNHYIPFLQSQACDPPTLNYLKDIGFNLTERLTAYTQKDAIKCFMGGYNTDCITIHNLIQNTRKTLYPIDENTLTFYKTAFWGTAGFFNSGQSWIYPVQTDKYHFSMISGPFSLEYTGIISINIQGNMVYSSYWDSSPQSANNGILTVYKQYPTSCYQGVVTNTEWGNQWIVNLCAQPNPY